MLGGSASSPARRVLPPVPWADAAAMRPATTNADTASDPHLRIVSALPSPKREWVFTLGRRNPSCFRGLPTRCESVGGADQFLGDARAVGGVPRMVTDHQLGARPDPAKVPGPSDRRLKIKASVHQDPRDAAQRVGAPEQAAVLEPRV